MNKIYNMKDQPIENIIRFIEFMEDRKLSAKEISDFIEFMEEE